jgi:hypothetical protein
MEAESSLEMRLTALAAMSGAPGSMGAAELVTNWKEEAEL